MPTLNGRAALCLRPAVAPAEIRAATRIVASVKRISFLDMNSLSLPFLRGQQSAQPFFEWNFRLPAEYLAGACDVGLTHLRVVDRECFEHDFTLGRGGTDNGLCELEQSELGWIPEVDGEMLSAHRQRVEPLDEVVHVTEAPRLRTVAEHGQRLVLDCLTDKCRNRTPVVRPHARSIGVEDAGDRRVDPLLTVVGHRHRLGVAFRLVIDAARTDRVDVAPVRLGLRMHLRVAVDLAGGEEQDPRGVYDEAK